jgi:hypothetical protein
MLITRHVDIIGQSISLPVVPRNSLFPAVPAALYCTIILTTLLLEPSSLLAQPQIRHPNLTSLSIPKNHIRVLPLPFHSQT